MKMIVFFTTALILSGCGATTSNSSSKKSNPTVSYNKTTACNVYKGQAAMSLRMYKWDNTYKFLRMAINDGKNTGNQSCFVSAIAFYVKFNKKFNYENNLAKYEKIMSKFNKKEKEIIKNDQEIESVSKILNAPKWP